MKKLLIMLFFFIIFQSFGQWDKLKRGTKLTYSYTLNETENGSQRDVFKMSYKTMIDTIITFSKETNERIILFSNSGLNPFLNYKQSDFNNGQTVLFYVNNDKIFSLSSDTVLIRYLKNDIMTNQLIKLIREHITKDEYDEEDITSLKLGDVIICFEPFIHIRSNDKNTYDYKTSYTGSYKFYKYTGKKEIKNKITQNVDVYDNNSFSRNLDATVFFSNDYGLIKSKAIIKSGAQCFKITFELIKVE